MAANDILPVETAGRKLPHPREYRLAGSQTIAKGEPVILNASGVLEEAATDPSAVFAIAAYAADDLAADSILPVWLVIDSETDWACVNFARDGAGTLVTPEVTDIGDQVGFVLASGSWIADSGAGNLIAEVVDVWDALGRSISDTRFSLPGVSTIVRFFAR